jgi:hypothetical protein
MAPSIPETSKRQTKLSFSTRKISVIPNPKSSRPPRQNDDGTVTAVSRSRTRSGKSKEVTLLQQQRFAEMFQHGQQKTQSVLRTVVERGAKHIPGSIAPSSTNLTPMRITNGTVSAEEFIWPKNSGNAEENIVDDTYHGTEWSGTGTFTGTARWLLDTTDTILDDNEPFPEEAQPNAECLDEDAGRSSRVLQAKDTEQYFQKLRVRIQQSLEADWTDIEDLQNRNIASADEINVQAEFERFRKAEATLSGWNPALLVAPSGHPSQPLHLKLNYPTFRTKHLEYGESADMSNNSTKLLMRKALTVSNAFWYEACFRRQSASSSRHKEGPMKLWPNDVTDLHTEFSNMCESFGKKVMVIFGAPNRKDFKQRYTASEQVVKASETELVTVDIVRGHDRSIDFIAVYCPHPEWLLWNWTIWAGKYYDACINVAATLAGVEVIPNWFEERARCVRASPTAKSALRDADTTRKLKKQNKVRCRPNDLPSTVRSFAYENGITEADLCKHFDAGWSVAQMVYDFVRSRQPARSSWNNGVRMPRNLPRNTPAQVSSGIFGASPPTWSNASPTASIIRIVPNVTKSKNPIVKTAAVHLGREIRLMCIRCGVTPSSKPVDTKPAFITISSAKGKYLAQRQRCITRACNPAGRKGQVDQFMVPHDPTIPFIRSDNLNKIKSTEDS